MATGPVVYRVGGLSPAVTVQSAEIRPEQLEEVPLPFGASAAADDSNWPPVGFTETNMPTATSSSADNTASLLATDYNLEWIQGDTAEFQWLFTDRLWTDTDPALEDPNAPVWEERVWASQVKNPYIYATYAADYWVPAYGYQYTWWRGHSIVAEFDCFADVVDIDPLPATPDIPRWATRVTMTLPADRSAMILPANWYKWDLQTRTSDDRVRTHLRGNVRVLTEWTVA